MTNNLKEKSGKFLKLAFNLYLIPYLDENAVKLQICFKTAFITVCLKQYILIVYFITEWLPCATMKDIMQMWAFGTYLIHFNIFFFNFSHSTIPLTFVYYPDGGALPSGNRQIWLVSCLNYVESPEFQSQILIDH